MLEKIDYWDDWAIYGRPSEYIFSDEESYGYEDERWKDTDIPFVLVSNFGRFFNEITRKFIKPTHGDTHGHKAIKVKINGIHYQEYIHRVIAKAFIPNPNNYPLVRHLDDNPDNNEIENLAWGTVKDNMNDMRLNGHAYYLTDEDREKYLSKQRKPVYAVNLDSKEKIYFDSATKAAEILGLHQANIWKILNGERKHTKNYTFYYVEDNQ